MGWWDTWNTVKESVKGTGKSIWNNASVTNAATGTLKFSYNTVLGLFEQLSVAPKVVYSSILHPQTRMVAGHLLHIAAEDLAPLVLVTYTNECLQQYGRKHLTNESDVGWLSTDTLLQSGLLLLQAATWAYATRKKAQMVARTTVVAIEAASALNKVKTTAPMTLCVDEKCTTLRFLKGSFRDIISYWATEAAIALVGYTPVVGGGMSAVLSVYHHGRYIMTLVLPDLCSRHQEQYLSQYTEKALALGIGHAGMTALTTQMIEVGTGIPAVFYKAAVQQFLLVTQVSVAAHMSLPAPVRESTRNLPDPLAIFQGVVGFTTDTLLLGLKKQIPRLLKEQRSSIIPWEKLPGIAVQVWSHPFTKKAKPYVLPRMLQSGQAFINDPVIASHWDGLRNRTIHAIENVEKIQGWYSVRVATWAPGMSSKALWTVFGTPKSVTKLLLSLMGNKNFMAELASYRRKLEGIYTGEPPSVPVDKDALPLRGHETGEKLDSKLTLTATTEEEKIKVELDPHVVIRSTQEASNSPKPVEIIKRRTVLLTEDKLEPSQVVRRGFFAEEDSLNPISVIRPRVKKSVTVENVESTTNSLF